MTKLFFAVALLTLVSCSEKEKPSTSENKKPDTAVEKEQETETNEVFSCNLQNNLELLVANGDTLDFKPTNIFANKYDNVSYRIIMTNYPMEAYSEYGELEEGQIKLVVGLIWPAGDDFEPGKYTHGGTDGKNSLAYALVVGKKTYSMNYANMTEEEMGSVEVERVNKQGLCGTGHIRGQKGNELKFTFNTKHVPL